MKTPMIKLTRKIFLLILVCGAVTVRAADWPVAQSANGALLTADSVFKKGLLSTAEELAAQAAAAKSGAGGGVEKELASDNLSAPKMNTPRLQAYKKNCDEMYALRIKISKNPNDKNLESLKDKQREASEQLLRILPDTTEEERQAMSNYSKYIDKKLSKAGINPHL